MYDEGMKNSSFYAEHIPALLESEGIHFSFILGYYFVIPAFAVKIRCQFRPACRGNIPNLVRDLLQAVFPRGEIYIQFGSGGYISRGCD